MDEVVKLKPNKTEEALRYWSTNLKAMLDHEYGKDRVGHIIIVFPYGENSSPSWITDARRDSVIRMLRELADHIESPDARIIHPH